MSTTVSLAVYATVWADVSGVSETGYITNEGNSTLLFREDSVQPGPTNAEGHTLYPRANYAYSVPPAQKLYMRAVSSTGRVVVTPKDIKVKK